MEVAERAPRDTFSHPTASINSSCPSGRVLTLTATSTSTMAAPPPALPNVQLLFGPMLIGVFFNMILFGVLVGQVLTYFQRYRQYETISRSTPLAAY
ncbi:hypothetical protein C8F04DRAFT_113384 [Mycena alexandri]|uniref:Uncharacterized protein n=1 Tax=Mycena alexandri TaxID=1745969 RepID=A0AAD6X9U7_9AGAR|nr:hypothetical protein C8F04DRAFT_113384 [Mycena alexandri]